MNDIYILYFFIALATIAFIAISIIFFHQIKQQFNVLMVKLNHKKRQYKKLFYLLKRYEESTIDWIFNSFVYFYENEYKQIEDSFAVDNFNFPEGKIDILNTYRYITKYRIDNIEDFKHLIINGGVEIYGSSFTNYNVKVDNDKRIHIHPSSSGNVVSTQMHHQNTLYTLDNETAKWIIDRRKFFGI